MLTITSNDIFKPKNKTSDKCHLANRLVMVSHLFGVSFFMGIYSTRIDLTGQKFERLLVISYAGKGKISKWLCQCDCGKTKIVQSFYLRSGKSKSCGCIRTERLIRDFSTHGKSKTPEFRIWASMKGRCSNPLNTSYHNYGGRGIKVCDRWLHSFENFLADMGKKPTHKHSIDRINNNGNYEPSNCRWATKTIQNNNRRDNLKIEFNGEFDTIGNISRKTGIPYTTIKSRLNCGVTDNAELFSLKNIKQERINNNYYSYDSVTKITKEQFEEILVLIQDGVSIPRIADKYSVWPSTIYRRLKKTNNS